MSTIQRAYKVELDLNNTQTAACKKHAGVARWAYNWGLARKQEAYRTTGKSPNAMELHRELNALKQADVPWMYEVSKCAPQEALRNLDRAFDRFFTLALAISDVGWGEFRRQLEYKAAWYGCRVIVADRWFASSRTCSCCGWVDESLELSDRVYICRNPDRLDCGLVMDRDLNAAINLSKLPEISPDSQNACGEGSAGLAGSSQMQLPSLKQEPDTFPPLVG